MHDGRVTGLALSYDDSCLISAAADGTLLLLANSLGPHPSAAPPQPPLEPNAGLPTMAEAAAAATAASAAAIAATAATAGVTAAAAAAAASVPLSLEEAKQAAQRNQQAATAAAARQQLVSAVEVLRQELAGLMREDAGRPPAERVGPEAFHVDEGEWDLVFWGGGSGV